MANSMPAWKHLTRKLRIRRLIVAESSEFRYTFFAFPCSTDLYHIDQPAAAFATR